MRVPSVPLPGLPVAARTPVHLAEAVVPALPDVAEVVVSRAGGAARTTARAADRARGLAVTAAGELPDRAVATVRGLPDLRHVQAQRAASRRRLAAVAAGTVGAA